MSIANLLVKGECIDLKCQHTVQFMPESEGSGTYKGVCGGCGAEYTGTISIGEPVIPGQEAAPAPKATTSKTATGSATGSTGSGTATGSTT